MARESCRRSPSRAPGLDGLLGLAEVPVFSDPVEEDVLGEDAADVLPDLGQLVGTLWLPDHRKVRREVVLVGVKGRQRR